MQAALVPIGYPGLINSTVFHLNFYTSPALLSIIAYAVVTVIMVYKFNEYVVLDNKALDIDQVFEKNMIAINAGLFT